MGNNSIRSQAGLEVEAVPPISFVQEQVLFLLSPLPPPIPSRTCDIRMPDCKADWWSWLVKIMMMMFDKRALVQLELVHAL
jgi:hypothetical protein